MKKYKGIPPFKAEANGLRRVLKHLPDEAGQIAVDHAHKNFKNERFGDGGKSKKWAKRKTKRKNNGRKLLVDSGELKASVDYEAGHMEVTIGSDKPYAQVHNEGGKAGRGNGFTMPKRPFMGPSSEIDAAIEKYLEKAMDHLFKA